MSIWKEIRCDERLDASGNCLSNLNAGPATFGTIRELYHAARLDGWEIDNLGKATCPRCRKTTNPTRTQIGEWPED